MSLTRYRSVVGEWEAFARAAGRPEPTVFRARRGRIGEEELLARLEAQGFRTRPLEGLPGFHRVEHEPRPLSATLEHWNGLLYVQQASTGVAAPALGPRPGERVLDLCAAPGGKTLHAAELMEDRGTLVASDISESRIRGLLGNVYRLAHTGVLAVAGDARHFPGGATFDRVLVDAPCSGEGTLRRRRGRVPHQSSSFRGYVTGAQRALLRRAVALTRPGGTILYVTCTFAPEENEAVVSEVLETEPVELEPLELPVPHARGLTTFEGTRYDPRVEGAARIYPHHLDSGGLFLARLRRLDGEAGAEEHAEAPGPGWSEVPDAFPGEDAEDPTGLVERALAELGGRWGVEPGRLAGLRWIVRGGRLWMHTVDAWPLPAWEAGGWRPISLGLRALEVDTRGRVRPTNDLLRALSGSLGRRAQELDTPTLRRLLAGEAVPVPEGEGGRGPVALAWRGEVVGRGARTAEGLRSEIPKARARDLLRALPEADL